jgi:hypothetical protein
MRAAIVGIGTHDCNFTTRADADVEVDGDVDVEVVVVVDGDVRR